MKYNEKYDRWITKGGLVYRYDSKQDKLVLCKQCYTHNGYLRVKVSKPKRKYLRVHILVWETFNGEIPQGYEIDHEDTHRDNNALSNLKLCTHKENMNNLVTKLRMKIPKSEFGKKFYEHYGLTLMDDKKLYLRESKWYHTHNKTCRWEKEV